MIDYSSAVVHAAKDYDMSLDEAQCLYNISKAKGENYTDTLEEFIKFRAANSE